MNKPIKITEYKKETGDIRKVLLLPSKDGKIWQYVNLTKGYICPCKFDSKEEALKDFIKYVDTFRKVEFEELNVQ